MMNRLIIYADSRFQLDRSADFLTECLICHSFEEWVGAVAGFQGACVGVLVCDLNIESMSHPLSNLLGQGHLKECVVVDMAYTHARHEALLKLGVFSVISPVWADMLLKRVCEMAFLLISSFEKLHLMCEKSFLAFVDEGRWTAFFKEHILECRRHFSLVKLDEILYNFPAFVRFDGDYLSRMEQRSSEFQFTKTLLGLDTLQLLIVCPNDQLLSQITAILPDYFEVFTAQDEEEALGILDDSPTIDIGIISPSLSEIDLPEFVQMLTHFNSDIQLVAMNDGVDGEAHSGLFGIFQDVLECASIGTVWRAQLYAIAQIHYIQRSLPRLGSYILSSDTKSKYKMLVSFCEEKWALGQGTTYGDVYLFFPELREELGKDALTPFGVADQKVIQKILVISE